MWDFEEGDKNFRMYKRFGKLDEFYRMRPDPTERQKELIGAFYVAKRDVDPDRKIPSDILEKYAGMTQYEDDVAVFMMKALDDYFMELRAEFIKQKMKSKQSSEK